MCFLIRRPKITKYDHYNLDTNRTIQITVRFVNLTTQEMEVFSNSLVDGKLEITREVSLSDPHGSYAIYRRVHPAFREFREEQDKRKKRSIYAKLRSQFPELPIANNADDCEAQLAEYEKDHPDSLEPDRIKGFFGAINVANGLIRRKTQFLLVPAVKEGSEFDSERSSPVVSLLNTISKQTLENKTDLQEYLNEAQSKIEQLANPEADPKLSAISSDITSIINKYYNDARVDASWDKSDIVSINFPRANIRVNHRGVDLPIAHLGHGLQRILIFSVLQYLARSRSMDDSERRSDGDAIFEDPVSDIIIAVEEPEIYQHPIKQRQIYENLKSLASGFDKKTGIRIQVIYTTHSEKMISLKEFGAMRLIRKIEREDIIDTIVSGCEISDVSSTMASYLGADVEPMSDDKLIASLHIFTDEISEGLFANKIVLVEGVSDRAALHAAYLFKGRNPNDDGIAIIRVDGKTKLDKPALIFNKLAIPVYVVFDSDNPEVNNKKINRLIQRICGVDNPEDYPAGCYGKFAAFEGDLNKYIDSCLGDKAGEIYTKLQAIWDLSKSEAKKSPAVMSSLMALANNEGIEFPLLDAIIDNVDAL